MPMCPANHFSVRLDFCDVCGTRMDPPRPVPPPAVPATQATPAAPVTPAEPCPQCGTARLGQFCEACGFDFASNQTPSWAFRRAALVPGAVAGDRTADNRVPGRTAVDGVGLDRAGPADASGPFGAVSWVAVATADRGYFDRVLAGGAPDARTIPFPRYCRERRFRLAGREIRIGRRSASRGIEPEIDLTGPPTDPGISHLHAVILAQPGGGWALLDPGSANGTLINGSELAPGERVALHPGDRVYLGAWTMLTILAG